MSPDLHRVFKTWWPLAASWLLMAAETPMLSAIVARLPDAEIHLAAYGGVVFPLALIIESPIIMLLPASTALCKDRLSYQRIYRFMMVAGGLLTLLHMLVAFTPMYSIVVEDLLGVPDEIIEPARLGLMIMTPWTWSIAFRRFNQGTLIRFGHSRTVGIGTLIRLTADVSILLGGLMLARAVGPERIPGIMVATSAVAAGVICEAIYAGLAVRPVLRREVYTASLEDPPLSWQAFFSFYIPLMMTSLLTQISSPIGSAALSRMPSSLPSLAVWPVVTGFIFMLRSLGVAYNEVVVALIENPRLYTSLQRFTLILAVFTTLLILLMATTPLADFWFGRLSALSPDLSAMAKMGLLFCLPLPGLSVLQSWYQGAILFGRQTRGVTESVMIYLAVSAIVLGIGVGLGRFTGLYVGLISISLSVTAQTAWLWWRARPVYGDIENRLVKPTSIAVDG